MVLADREQCSITRRNGCMAGNSDSTHSPAAAATCIEACHCALTRKLRHGTVCQQLMGPQLAAPHLAGKQSRTAPAHLSRASLKLAPQTMCATDGFPTGTAQA
jgi:hypothetical protein